MHSLAIYTASRIFTGEDWLTGHSIIARNGRIEKIVNTNDIPTGPEIINFQHGFLAPAFIDAQIYGAHGKLLSVFPEVESLLQLVKYCRDGGAAWCMPTVATNEKKVFFQCIDAINEYLKQGGTGILGLHVEGPWINSLKRGAHLETFIHSPSKQEVKELLDYGEGVIKVITLAPEVCDPDIIKYILSRGIIVSAGHSNATYRQSMDAFELGITSVTHLFNAMSPLHHREPGLAGAAMIGNVMTSMVPDGHHVDFAALRIAKKVMGDRLYAITDAVTETTEGPYHHHFSGDKYEAAGILSGSALTMAKALYNIVNHMGVNLEEGLRMCSLYPAQAIRTDGDLGKIKVGYKADMVVLKDDLQVIGVV